MGIGGAEALIINVALALQFKGYDVTIYTPFFDPNRCLKEALDCKVSVRGNWFPRTIFGRCIALCAYIRMMLCALWVVLFAGRNEWYVIDQVSMPIPLLRCRQKTLFYCHHPDKLLCTNRGNWLMKAYRCVLDFVEEVTTSFASVTLVNSKYTQDVYKQHFPLIQRCCRGRTPAILYPAIDFKMFDRENSADFKSLLGYEPKPTEIIITSLNRYERKKDIPLALKSVAGLH